MRSLIILLFCLIGITGVLAEEYIDEETAYFSSLDEDAERANLARIKEEYQACKQIDLPSGTVEEVHLLLQAQYACYKNVAFSLIDTFQPRVADEVKKEFQVYLEMYDKMKSNQYYKLDSCRGSCGTIVRDYIEVDRTMMLEEVVKQYIVAVDSYVRI